MIRTMKIDITDYVIDTIAHIIGTVCVESYYYASPIGEFNTAYACDNFVYNRPLYVEDAGGGSVIYTLYTFSSRVVER